MARLSKPVSAIGFGAFKIGRNQGAKYPNTYDLPSPQEVDQLLHAVLDLGVTYIDTAPAYGASEEHIGRAIGHRHDEFLLSTKVGETFADGVSIYDFSMPAVRTSIERSLTRLRRDMLDLVFVHAPRDDARVLRQTDVVPTLLNLRDQGKVRSLGFSGHTIEGFEAALSWADALMLTYRADDRTLEPIIIKAAQRNIEVMVKKGLASGHLPAEESIRFVLQNRAISSMVIGTLNAEHMAANLHTAESIRSPAVAPTRSVKREHPR